jgi:hypothetical protein
MKTTLIALLAATLLASTVGCRDKRDDETSRGEKRERIDTIRGVPPSR